MPRQTFRAPGGAELSYQVDDFTDPGSSPITIVLQHGFPRNSNFFYAWVPALSRRFRVVRPDLRGLGKSKVPAAEFTNSMDSLVGDALALLDHLQQDRVIWVGEASGGLLGFNLAARASERLLGLAAFTSSMTMARWRLLEFERELLGENPGREAVNGADGLAYMQRVGMRRWAQAWVKSRPWLAKEQPKGLMDFYVDELSDNDPHLVAEFFRPIPAVELLPLFPDITCPVLYMDGTWAPALDRGDLAILEQQEWSSIVTIDGPGMDIGYARPDACVAAVESWVDSAMA